MFDKVKPWFWFWDQNSKLCRWSPNLGLCIPKVHFWALAFGTFDRAPILTYLLESSFYFHLICCRSVLFRTHAMEINVYNFGASSSLFTVSLLDEAFCWKQLIHFMYPSFYLKICSIRIHLSFYCLFLFLKPLATI